VNPGIRPDVPRRIAGTCTHVVEMCMEIGAPDARRRAPDLPAEAQACQHCSSQTPSRQCSIMLLSGGAISSFLCRHSPAFSLQNCRQHLSLAADNPPIGAQLQHRISKRRLPEADPLFNR
jgi:hypothetical protein